jgi:hypothetical protein
VAIVIRLCVEHELFAHQIEKRLQRVNCRRDQPALEARDGRLRCPSSHRELVLAQAVAPTGGAEELSGGHISYHI